MFCQGHVSVWMMTSVHTVWPRWFSQLVVVINGSWWPRWPYKSLPFCCYLKIIMKKAHLSQNMHIFRLESLLWHFFYSVQFVCKNMHHILLKKKIFFRWLRNASPREDRKCGEPAQWSRDCRKLRWKKAPAGPPRRAAVTNMRGQGEDEALRGGRAEETPDSGECR